MIISHKHKYLFVELQHTASSAINKELRQNYDGVPILGKHSTYDEFLRVATAEEKDYFVFSGIRNPLDEAVSIYLKYKTNHKGFFTYPYPKRLSKASLRRYNFIKNTNADFPAFFKKVYTFPYDNWSSLSHKEFDFIIRFENLQVDFAEALDLIALKQKRPLPRVNKTREKDRELDFLSFYTPDIYEQARWVFDPFMKKWGYDFPSEWGDNRVSLSSQIVFDFFGVFRRFYWRHRRRKTLYGRLFRKLFFSEAWIRNWHSMA